jgi:hypothetical protein
MRQINATFSTDSRPYPSRSEVKLAPLRSLGDFMRSQMTWKKLWSSKNIPILLTITIATFLGSMPARAFTCEDVRGLSTAEQNYWSKQLNLSSTQRHLIWVACYRNYRPKTEEIVRR